MKFLASALLTFVVLPVGSSFAQTPTLAPPSQPQPPATSQDTTQQSPAEILRDFKSYYIKSDTIYLHRETLLKELEKRGEFSAWGLTPAEDSKAADVVIVITLPFLTWEWNYRMLYQPTGAELGKGKISAAVEKTAAPQLAAMIVKRIGEARPLPTAFQETEAANQPQANSATETGQSWKVKYLSGSITGIPKNSSVTLTVNPERITFHASKTASFSVPTPMITTVVSSTQVRKASKGWDEFWDTTFTTVGGGDGGGAVLVIPAIPIALLGYGVLAPMKVSQHFVSIYWLEDGAMKSAEFSAGIGDAKPFLAELSKATGKNNVNIEESIKRKKEWIAKEYYRSPIVKIEKKVSIGWGDLAPGEYHVMFDPSGPGIAEVYFYPAKRSFFDVDLVTQGVAQYESGITNLVPSVTYREQNGVTMLDQIETRRVILRFTPIPLGFAN